MAKTIPDNIPLCVDLDGTLLRTDLLYESVIYLLKKNLFFIFVIPFWLLKGRYYTKFKLLEFVSPSVIALPYNQDVIDYIKIQKSLGRKIILVTATAEPLAQKVADFLGIFDEVIASKNGLNLLGTEKSIVLVDRFGAKGFDYIGDSFKDLPVWEKSNKSLICTSNPKLTKSAAQISDVEKIFNIENHSFNTFIKQIRIHQWIKNLLLLLPGLLAHKTNLDSYTSATLGFIAFSLVASAIYIINDLADIESDRNHKTKKNRPLASGKMSILTSFKLIPLLIIVGFGISIVFLDSIFSLILFFYMLLTIFYSFKLKKQYLLDIIILSILYTTRLVAGGILSNTELSPWLLSFSMFIFLSLGALKRYTELQGLLSGVQTKTRGRDYYVEDIPLINTLGISTGVVSTLVFTLYINNPEVVTLYRNSHLLYLITPIVLYWIVRLWFIAHRGNMNDDPIVFAVKDKVSYVVGFLILVISIGATL